MDFVRIHPDDIDTIVRLLAETIRNQPANSDPWLTREQAASHLNLPLRTFDRKRAENPETLRPVSEHPLRWSTNALDAFKFASGPTLVRRGRKRKAVSP